MKKQIKNKKTPITLVVFLDIVFIGLGLIIFALFHHVIPRAGSDEARILSNEMTDNEEAEQTEDTNQLYEDDNEASESKFIDKFTDGEIIQTEDCYISDNLNITVEQIQENEVTYYVADIYIKNYTSLLSAFAQDTYGKGFVDTTLNMAMDNDAILAISGDYYGNGDDGLVIRNGILYRDEVVSDVLIMNEDGSMETYSEAEFDIDTVIQNGAYQGWSFGPELLDDGQVITHFDNNRRLIGENPRCGVGYYEAGHYCFVVVDGRQKGYSDGMTLPEFSQLFYDLGCSVAYNMDGGKSAVMVFLGEVVNQPASGGRQISDIVYVK